MANPGSRCIDEGAYIEGSKKDVVYNRRRHGNWKTCVRNKRTSEIRVVTSGIFDF
jgi:hypothetical protein